MSPVGMLLGLRVVRGPDWNLGSLDGEEGGVGTVVSVEIGLNGRPLPDKSVLVYWDAGPAVICRAGLGDCYDLRVYDSASAGVSHSQFTCDECDQSAIAGIRWHCSECFNYDLCSDCYMNDKHHKHHNFVRFYKPNDRTDGRFLKDRLNATKVRARGIFPGATVRLGQHLTLDSGKGSFGQVFEFTAWEGKSRSAVTIQWSDGVETTHRFGYEGKVDLEIVDGVDGPFYYKDHLPVVEYQALGAPDSHRDFRVGDQVRVKKEHETVKKMAQEHGKANGNSHDKVGRIFKIDDLNKVHVAYGPVWTFNPEVLQKVPEMPVRANDAKDEVNNLWLKMLWEAFQGYLRDIQEEGGNGDIEEAKLQKIEDIKQVLEQYHPELLTEQDMTEQLYLAAATGNLERVRYILALNEDLVNRETPSGRISLHVACESGNADVVSCLLENGADVGKKDEDGYTPLHYAACGDAAGECVVLMLSANAIVHVVSENTKMTPLHLAIEAENVSAVTALIHSGECDVNYQNASGNTPLHLAVFAEDSSNLAEILKLPNLDPCICNNNGLNALHVACEHNNVKATRALINKFPKLIDVKNQDGFAPLHLAVLSRHCEVAKLLINEGHCTVDLPDNKGSTALALAVSLSHNDIVEILLEYGANVNAVDDDGETPLHIAVRKYCISQKEFDLRTVVGGSVNLSEVKKLVLAIMQSLVVGGADINLKNNQGNTPLDVCIDDELGRTLEQLLKYQSSSWASNAPSHQSPTKTLKKDPKDSSGVALSISSKSSTTERNDDGSKSEASCNIPSCDDTSIPARDGRGEKIGANENNMHTACDKIAVGEACANENNQNAACKKIAEEEVGANMSITDIDGKKNI